MRRPLLPKIPSKASINLGAPHLWSAIVMRSTELVVFLTFIMAGSGFWGVLLPPSVGLSYMTMPQGWLFFPIVTLATFGLTSKKQGTVGARA